MDKKKCAGTALHCQTQRSRYSQSPNARLAEARRATSTSKLSLSKSTNATCVPLGLPCRTQLVNTKANYTVIFASRPFTIIFRSQRMGAL